MRHRDETFGHLKPTAGTTTLQLPEELLSTFKRNHKRKIYPENQNIHVNFSNNLS